MTERIQKAIDIFLDAINEGTLAKGTCTACAVGNLVAHGKGGEILKNVGRYGYPTFKCTVENGHWANAFITDSAGQGVYEDMFSNPQVLDNVAATDFTIEELMQIELAFESNTAHCFTDYGKLSPEKVRRDQIKGLAAVVKVMLSFDSEKEVQDSEVYECFTSKAELIPIAQ
jgi:hypothetical protein